MISLARFTESLVDALYPPKCGLCDVTGPRGLCDICRDEMIPHPSPVQYDQRPGELRMAASFFLYEGRAAQAVQRLKYERATSLALPMSRILRARMLEEGLLSDEVLVPVPIHWRRRCHRGFNQSELLCQTFGSDQVVPGLLRRIRFTQPQVGLTHDQRLANLKDAFRADERVRGKRILLIDDVLTSGQTVRECAKSLYQAGADWVGACAFAGA